MHFYSRNIHGYRLHVSIELLLKLRPKLLIASLFHFSLTLGAGMLIPYPDAVAAAVEAQASHLTPIGWCHISDDATHHNILDGLTIRARHCRNLLTEEPTPFVCLGLIATSPAAISQFPSHLTL